MTSITQSNALSGRDDGCSWRKPPSSLDFLSPISIHCLSSILRPILHRLRLSLSIT